jgi:capsular exopolysaccharide synthesis family protein
LSTAPQMKTFSQDGYRFNKLTPGMRELVTELDPHSTTSEAYRILASNLNFKNIDQQYRFIAVTSSLPGEGKSTTAANLAITLAQGGKRVILVDADLRKPTQHKKFGLSFMEGLTNVLVEGIDPISLCKQFKELSLFVLTAGAMPPNSSELLGSKRMKLTLERLGEEADFVIVDCPPVLGLNDTLAITSRVDGFLLVVGSGKVPKKALVDAKEELEKVGAKLIGAVVNGLGERDSGSYYYGYYGEVER